MGNVAIPNQTSQHFSNNLGTVNNYNQNTLTSLFGVQTNPMAFSNYTGSNFVQANNHNSFPTQINPTFHQKAPQDNQNWTCKAYTQSLP